MADLSYLTYSALDIHQALKARTITCSGLLDALFSHIDQTEGQVKSYISVLKDLAYERAQDLDGRFDKGDALPALAGVPIALKDNLNLRGFRTTCASKLLENFESPYTATAVRRVLDAGLIPVAKANLDEFAMGASTENSAYFTSANPWDLERVPGGSSGGSASCVSAGQSFLSLGSDTGGSIRQPAAFCGITGMKPTYGRVSRYGLVAFASSLDQIGPFGRSVADVAALLNVICGEDERDSTSAAEPVPDFTATLGQDIKGLRLAMPKEIFELDMNDCVKDAVIKASDVLKNEGAILEDVSFDMFEYAVSTYYILAPAEASANLARFDGVRYTSRVDAPSLKEMMTATRGRDFGKEVQRRIILGTYVLSSGYYDAYYLKAQKVRTLIKDRFNDLFKNADVMILPTTPDTAFKPGEHEDPLSMYMADIATIPANMAGLPAISVPCGVSKDGLPIGVQIIGKPFDEATVLRVASAFQACTDHHKCLSPILEALK